MQYSLGFPDMRGEPWSCPVFFALRPDREASEQIDRVAAHWMRRQGLRWKRRPKTLHHVTLHGVCDHPQPRERVIHAAKLTGASVVLPRFPLTLRAMKSLEGAPAKDGRDRDYPLVLLGTDDGLTTLHRLLGAAMARQGLRPSTRLTPHLTVAYGPRALPYDEIEPINFVVTEFCLIRSAAGLSDHRILASWPLNG